MSYSFELNKSSDVPISDLNRDRFWEFLGHWQTACATNFAPSWGEFCLHDLPPRLIPYCSVRDVVQTDGKVTDFMHRFYGTAHINDKGYDLTGLLVSEHPSGPEHAARLFQENIDVVNSRMPKASSRSRRLGKDDLMFYRVSLRLPLSMDRKNVDQVVTLAAWSRDEATFL